MYRLKDFKLNLGNGQTLQANDLQFIEQGHIVVIGANGSGKTSFFKALMNVHDYQGTIEYQGQDIKAEFVKEKILYLPQDLEYYFVMQTVMEEQKYFTNISEEEFWQNIEKLNLNIFHDTNPHLLSGGEKIRLALAMMPHEIEVILMDETLEMNDYRTLQKMEDVIEGVKKRGTLIIEITHNLKRIEKADQILYLMENEIMELSLAEFLEMDCLW